MNKLFVFEASCVVCRYVIVDDDSGVVFYPAVVPF
jgi:hypothetical protein